MNRPSMHFLAVKSVAQEDIQAVHRIRAELLDQRKSKGNQIRGLAGEYRLVAPRQLCHLRQAIRTGAGRTRECPGAKSMR